MQMLALACMYGGYLLFLLIVRPFNSAAMGASELAVCVAAAASCVGAILVQDNRGENDTTR